MGDMNIHITWLPHVRTGLKKKIADRTAGRSELGSARAREQSVHAHSMDRKSKQLLIRKILCTLVCQGGGIRKWAWSEVKTAQFAVAGCVRLQPQNTEDKSRGTTETYTVKSFERSLRSGHTGLVKVSEFSSQIRLLQTNGRDEPKCRGTIRNIFKIRTKAFSKNTSNILRNSIFSQKVYVPHNY